MKSPYQKSATEADRSRFFLPVILLLAALLRVPFLSTIPNGLYADEASTGYDAYSILNTYRDQYGEFLPLFARSFGDYVEALYRFLVVPSVGVLGLNEFSVRLPAALIGISTVWILYSLVKALFNAQTARLAALLLAISPWHIQFSRCGFRAILLPLFFCLALLLFLKSLRKPVYIFPSAIAFAVCLYTYSFARVFVPLFMVGLLFMFWRELWKIRKQALLSAILFLCIFVPLFRFWISPEGMARAGISLITDPSSIVLNYVSYFNPWFLFFGGDPNPRHSPLNVGQLHYFELVTVPVGIWGLVREKRKKARILWLWLLLYPIPAALTAPEHALRSLAGAPLFASLSGYGFLILAAFFKRPKAKAAFLTAGALIAAAGLTVYAMIYFLDYPEHGARGWQYGMKEAITTAEESPYRCIIVSDRAFFYPAYIFVLFYTRYAPLEYHRLPPLPKRELWMYTKTPLGRYYTLNISDLVLKKGVCLLMIRPDEMTELEKKGYDWREVHTVRDPYGKEAIRLIEVKGRE